MIIILIIFAGIKAASKLFLAHGQQSDNHNLIRELIAKPMQRQKRAADKLHGYGGAVRRYYRRFIKLIVQNGAKPMPHHTSQDLEGIAASLLGDNGRDLRNVYIRARYSANEITKEDTIKAKDALRRLKSGKGASNA